MQNLNLDVPSEGVEWIGLAEFPVRWPGLTSGCTFGAKLVKEMRLPSPNKAGAGNGARTLSSQVDALGRAVPDLFRSVRPFGHDSGADWLLERRGPSSF
jgi:hypothetical protein